MHFCTFSSSEREAQELFVGIYTVKYVLARPLAEVAVSGRDVTFLPARLSRKFAKFERFAAYCSACPRSAWVAVTLVT